MLTILLEIEDYFYQSGTRRVEPLLEPKARNFDTSSNFASKGRLMAPPYARAALLDRDGTVIADCGYLADPEGVEILPGAAEGLARMRSFGLGLAVLTNQSGIGRGYFDAARLGAIHVRMEELLEARGVRLDGIYYCPCHPDRGCACRKPRTGLVSEASAELGFDPSRSFVIGDKGSDIQMGRAVLARTFLVRSGATIDGEAAQERPDYVVETLLDAATRIEEILRRERSP